MLRLPWSSSLLVSLSLASCLLPVDELGQESSEVVNGTPVVGYPSAGSLQRAGGDGLPGLVCSGTLIGCDTFLTAAHCVCEDLDGDPCGAPTPASELTVYFQHGGIYQVASSVPHPDFSFPDNDIAVLRLTEPVTGIRPARLQRENPAIDSQLTIVGFGNTQKNSGDDGIKREGVLQRVACERQDDALMLCFDGEDSPAVSCNGDSGGPNYLNVAGLQHVAGVVSGGGSSESCSVRQKFATLVAAFLEFIEEHGGELGQEQCGDIPGAEDPRSRVKVGEGDVTRVFHEVEVPTGTAELRIGANSLRGNKLRLGVARGRQPDYIVDDCGGDGRMSSYCRVLSPEPGLYHVVVSADRYHQVAMTSLPGAPAAVTDLYEAFTGKPLRVRADRGLLINDQARRGQPLRVEATVAPRHGSIVIEEDGSFVYESEPDYVGIDSFGYRVHEAPYSAETRVFVEVREEDLGDCGCSTSSPRSAGNLLVFLMALFWSFGRKRMIALRK